MKPIITDNLMLVAALTKDKPRAAGTAEERGRGSGHGAGPPPPGPGSSPVKLPQSVIEVAPKDTSRGGCRRGSIRSKASMVARSVLWTLRSLLGVMLTGHQEASVSLSWRHTVGFWMPCSGYHRSSRCLELRLGDQGGLRCPSLDFPGEIQNMRKSSCSSDGFTPGPGRVGEGVGGSRCHGEAHLQAGLGAWAPEGQAEGEQQFTAWSCQAGP